MGQSRPIIFWYSSAIDTWAGGSIDPVEEDHLLPSIPLTVSQPSEDQDTVVDWTGRRIGNWHLLGDDDTKRTIADGGILKRGTRYSLTCRDVERVSSARSFRLN